jgi:tripartite-type tricarboxylate transporter receptor subunit TctC
MRAPVLALCCGLTMAGLTGMLPARAQSIDNYPTKPIRIVLPFGAPGGASDIVARLISTRMAEVYGQQVLFDPRNGAGGILGTEIVARAAPDGYTFLITGPAHAINLALHSKLPYDTLADFAPVSLVYEVANILVVHPSVPARSVKELIAHARANPGTLTYGSAGNGTSQHLGGELFSKMVNVKMIHVPYKSGAAAATDLLGGRINLSFGSNTSLPHVRSGKLFALGVTSSRRLAALPDLPTIAESGVPDYESTAWYAMLAPAKTPRPMIDRMQTEFSRAISTADVKEKLAAQMIEPVGSRPAELDAFIKREIAKWSVIVKESGAKAE